MKKNIALLFLLISAALLNSCHKTEENVWIRFYGYTKADIVGHYEANPDTSVYTPMPTEDVQFYSNATIDITSLDGDLVRLRIIIPDVINKNFTGVATVNENDSNLGFHNTNKEDIIMTVYKNSQNQVRLHGMERRYILNSDGEIIDCIVHGFDVVKTSE